jgi:hypothetical protein
VAHPAASNAPRLTAAKTSARTPKP